MCSRHLQKHFSGPMIGLTGKPTGKFHKTYCLQPKQFAMWQTLIAMQAQISASACFSATQVGRHAAVPPFHILLVFRQLHFFFLGWRRRYAIQISPHVVFTISCQATFSRLNAAVHQRNNSGLQHENWACNATRENTALSTMAPKIMIWSRKKAANLSLFSESSSWMRNQ